MALRKTKQDDRERASRESQQNVEFLRRANNLEREFYFSHGKVFSPRKAKVEKGRYRYWIQNIVSRDNLVGKFGTYDQYIFTFLISSPNGEVSIPITIPYVISTSPTSPFGELLTVIASEFEGEKIRITDLINLEGNCEVNHRTSNNNDTYEVITILSIERPDDEEAETDEQGS